MSPITDAERDQVRKLHAQDYGRNKISELTGIHARRVSAIAKDLGLTFRRGPRVAAATEARKADAASRRAALALALLDDAERLRKQLWEPATIHNFGGRDNTYNSHQLDEPLFGDKLKISQATGVLIDRSLRLTDYDAERGAGEVRSMLGELGRALGVAVEAIDQAETPGDD